MTFERNKLLTKRSSLICARACLKTWYKIENNLKAKFGVGVKRMRHTLLLHFLI